MKPIVSFFVLIAMALAADNIFDYVVLGRHGGISGREALFCLVAVTILQLHNFSNRNAAAELKPYICGLPVSLVLGYLGFLWFAAIVFITAAIPTPDSGAAAISLGYAILIGSFTALLGWVLVASKMSVSSHAPRHS